MAYVNGTTHYNLPQTVGTDKRDWADTNEAFANLDAAVYSAVEDVADAQTEINGLKDRMTTAEGNITTNTDDISALDGRLTTAEGTITQHTSDIADVRSDCEDMICAYNEATATSTHAYAVGDYFIYNDVLYRAIQAIAIGDTIVPDTNCTTTNVTTEILANTRSNLVAQAVFDGVKTVAQGLNSLALAFTIDTSKEYLLVMHLGTDTIYTLHCRSISSNALHFSYNGANPLQIYSGEITASTALSSCHYHTASIAVADSTITATTLDSTIPSAGDSYMIYELNTI